MSTVTQLLKDGILASNSAITAGATNTFAKTDGSGNLAFIGPKQPSVRVYNSAVQSILNTTYTSITFDSERWNTDAAGSMHSTLTNTSRLTCQSAGIYEIFAHAGFDANATGQRQATFLLNGTLYIGLVQEAPISGSFTFMVEISTQYQLAVSDYVELQLYQSSGGALNNVVAGNYVGEFGMTRISS